MKFMLHINPVVPASPTERERLRPIAHRTDKVQQMLQEMLELTQMAEELGFEAVTFSEHHFYTEGMEAGSTPTPHLLNLLSKTKRIKVGPLGVFFANVGSDSSGMRCRLGRSDEPGTRDRRVRPRFFPAVGQRVGTALRRAAVGTRSRGRAA